MADINLIFIPSPGVGHFVSTLEIAKLLLRRDHRLSITFLILNHPNFSVASIASSITSDRINFLDVPNEESESPGFFNS
ncbi:unnamed protein product [Rhodiola kirilowii]